MTAQLLNLDTRRHTSRVLTDFIASQPGDAAKRAGLAPAAPKAATVRDADSAVMWGGMDWSEFMRGGLAGGVGVNEQSARAVAAVVACSNLIGGSIGSLPLHFYREAQDGLERIKSDLWWLFNERTHEDWSAAAFWQYVADSRSFHGDSFSRIHRASRFDGRPVGFEPWHPLLVDVDRRADGSKAYTFWPRDTDPVTAKPIVLEADDVLHVPGPGFNGLRSLSQLQFGLRYPAGIASAADEQAGQFMADGARPDYAIEVPGGMEPENQEVLRQSWLKRHSGQGAKKAPVVLAGGMKLHQLTLSMEDAQLLTTRAFQVEEICRIFGVPPFMIGHTEKTSSWGSGVEQMGIGFVKYTLTRHLRPIEQEINHKLFKTARNSSKFLTAGLERGDIKTRFEAYRIAIGRAGERGWMHPSEARTLEDMTPDDTVDTAAPNPGTPNDPKKDAQP